MNWLHDFLAEDQKLRTDKTDRSLEMGLARSVHSKILPNMATPLTDKTDRSPERDPGEREAICGADLETRLRGRGISIGIDRKSGRAYLLFKPADAEIVQDVAAVHQPFEIQLMESQRRELLGSLDYYEGLLQRQ